jgi:ribosomal protein S18 acetylase RimI-like enzyme
MGKILKTPKGEVAIYQAEPSEAGAVRELRLEALSRHPEVFGADYASSAEEGVAAWEQRIHNYESDRSGLICLASANRQLVGMSGLFRGRSTKMQHTGNIWGVYVKADWRGLHLAEALLDECLAWAQSQGLIVAKLAVITTNTAAIRCYTRSGFTTYGTDPKVIHYNNTYYDEFLMSKLFL